MTGVSAFDECRYPFFGCLPCMLQELLERQGATFSSFECLDTPGMIVDRNLISGPNEISTTLCVQTFSLLLCSSKKMILLKDKKMKISYQNHSNNNSGHLASSSSQGPVRNSASSLSSSSSYPSLDHRTSLSQPSPFSSSSSLFPGEKPGKNLQQTYIMHDGYTQKNRSAEEETKKNNAAINSSRREKYEEEENEEKESWKTMGMYVKQLASVDTPHQDENISSNESTLSSSSSFRHPSSSSSSYQDTQRERSVDRKPLDSYGDRQEKRQEDKGESSLDLSSECRGISVDPFSDEKKTLDDSGFSSSPYTDRKDLLQDKRSVFLYEDEEEKSQQKEVNENRNLPSLTRIEERKEELSSFHSSESPYGGHRPSTDASLSHVTPSGVQTPHHHASQQREEEAAGGLNRISSSFPSKGSFADVLYEEDSNFSSFLSHDADAHGRRSPPDISIQETDKERTTAEREEAREEEEEGEKRSFQRSESDSDGVEDKGIRRKTDGFQRDINTPSLDSYSYSSHLKNADDYSNTPSSLPPNTYVYSSSR